MDVSEDKNQIHAHLWNTMELTELESQREIMYDRLYGLNNITTDANAEQYKVFVTSIQQGIGILSDLIQRRMDGDE